MKVVKTVPAPRGEREAPAGEGAEGFYLFIYFWPSLPRPAAALASFTSDERDLCKPNTGRRIPWVGVQLRHTERMRWRQAWLYSWDTSVSCFHGRRPLRMARQRRITIREKSVKTSFEARGNLCANKLSFLSCSLSWRLYFSMGVRLLELLAVSGMPMFYFPREIGPLWRRTFPKLFTLIWSEALHGQLILCDVVLPMAKQNDYWELQLVVVQILFYNSYSWQGILIGQAFYRPVIPNSV